MLCAQKHQAVNRTQEELSDLGSVKASQVCVFAGHRTESLGQSRLQNLCCEGGSSDFQSICTTSDAPGTHPVPLWTPLVCRFLLKTVDTRTAMLWLKTALQGFLSSLQ